MEAWLSGPLDGVNPVLMPAAHALVQARRDIASGVAGLASRELALRPGGVASLGFHLRHVAGSIDRLLTYARGEMLDERQWKVLALEESGEGMSIEAGELTNAVHSAIDEALRVMRETDVTALQDPRSVGRAALPTTVFGLLFHIAEHTQRHTGQIIATAKIVRAGVPADVMIPATQTFSASAEEKLSGKVQQ
ncbi:MAG: DinB family protein [Anaerolineae bacterium]|nr:DinB family protein [Gemmatimonadaceae bacterium]